MKSDAPQPHGRGFVTTIPWPSGFVIHGLLNSPIWTQIRTFVAFIWLYWYSSNVSDLGIFTSSSQPNGMTPSNTLTRMSSPLLFGYIYSQSHRWNTPHSSALNCVSHYHSSSSPPSDDVVSPKHLHEHIEPSPPIREHCTPHHNTSECRYTFIPAFIMSHESHYGGMKSVFSFSSTFFLISPPLTRISFILHH